MPNGTPFFLHADLLLLSAATSSQLTVLRDSIRAVKAKAASSAIRVLVGGAAFVGVTDLVFPCGADGYAADADQALRQAEAM